MPKPKYKTNINYKQYKQALMDTRGLDVNNDKTYNYKKFFRKEKQQAVDMLNSDPEAHFPDTYKTRLHPTFSKESREPGYKRGGTWTEDKEGYYQFRHSPYTAKHIEDTNEYLGENYYSGGSYEYATYKGKAYNPTFRGREILRPVRIYGKRKKKSLSNTKGI